MKKNFLFVLFAAFTIAATAQDYGKLTLNYQTKKYEDAKTDIDKLANDDKAKDKAETYLWKAAVYGSLYADSNLAAKYPNADQQSYDAFTAYQQKDPALKLIKEGTTSLAINGISALYTNSINQGIADFNKKDYQNSFNSLRRATALSDFIVKNGFSSNKEAIDTLTVLYTGHAAQNLAQSNSALRYYTDSALRYYKMLADRKVGGKGLDEMYRLMLVNLSSSKQSDDFKKYLAEAKELYPDQASLWSQLEMSNMNENASLDQIVTKYNQESSGTLNEEQLENYATTFANPQQLKTLDSAKKVQYQLMASDIYKRVFGLNPNQGIYAINAGLLNNNIFNTLEDYKQDSLRGEGSGLKAKRANIVNQQQVYADSAIIWLEKGYTVLKAKTDRNKTEANSLNKAVDMLANLYVWKRDQTKGTAAAKDYDKYDAKYQQYDAEHDKYKM